MAVADEIGPVAVLPFRDVRREVADGEKVVGFEEDKRFLFAQALSGEDLLLDGGEDGLV